MTHLEEIEQLKTQLALAKDGQAEAELLLALLKEYAFINSADSQPYIKRLLGLAESTDSARYKAWGLYYSGNASRATGDYDTAMALSLQALSLFSQLEDTDGIAKTNNNIGAVHTFKSNYPDALKHYALALRIEENNNNDNGTANVYNNIGTVYYYMGNFPEAQKNYLQAMEIREKTGDKWGLANSYNNLGIIQDELGNYAEALTNYMRVLHFKKEVNDIKGIASAHNNIGNIHYFKGNYPEALKDYLTALQLREEFGDKQGIGNSYINIGHVHYKQGNNAEAIKNYLQAINILEKISDKKGISHSYHGLGRVYAEQNDLAGGIKCGLFAYGLAVEINNKELIKKNALALFNSYKADRNFEEAVKYLEKYYQVESEMLGEQAQKKLAALSFQHDMEQKEKQLEIEQLRNVELKRERDRSDTLLLNILPAEVAEELKEKGSADAKLFSDITVLFTDFVGFTTASERLTPQELVDELHACFSAFDNIISKYGIEKIKTVGDSYLAVAGLPHTNHNHAVEIVKAALEIRDFISHRREQSRKKTFEIRIGLHSGHAVAGIVGIRKFAYDIWGDTVNTAARMEQNSEAGKVNISEATYQLVKDKFACEYRGDIEAKNKGRLKMYFVEG